MTTDSYKILMEKLGHPEAPLLRKVLEHLMTPEQARLVVQLPASPEELSGRLGLAEGRVRETLEDAFRKGFVYRRLSQNREEYRFSRDMMQLHDGTLASTTLDPVLNELWEVARREVWDPRLRKEYAERTQPAMRALPTYRSVKDNPGLLPIDDVREHLRAARVISVVPCACRRAAVKAVCTKAPGKAGEVCIQFDRSGEYSLQRGNGRKLTVEEAMAVVDQAEELGLVHIMTDNKAMATGVLCNCCGDCCVWWRPVRGTDISIGKVWSKSRFQATVDQARCTGCQVCVERCIFDAVEMVKPPGSKIYKASIDPDKCWGCGVCYVKCAPQAISLKLVRPPDHIPEPPRRNP